MGAYHPAASERLTDSMRGVSRQGFLVADILVPLLVAVLVAWTGVGRGASMAIVKNCGDGRGRS